MAAQDEQQKPAQSPTNGAAPADGGAAPAADPVIDAGGAGEADAGAPDDGLSPEERAQFEELREADAGAEGDAGAAQTEVDAGAQAADAAAATAAPAAGEDDADDEPEPVNPAPGQPGHDPNAQPKPKRVSYGKFRRTEDQLKQTEAQLRAALDTTARFDERMKILQEALKAPPTQEAAKDDDPMPDPETHVFEHIAWQNRRAEKLERAINDIQSGRQNERSQQDLQTVYSDDARGFMAKEPNFPDAYKHLMATRVVQVALINYNKDILAGDQLTPQEKLGIANAVGREERELAASALRAGKSPAANLYALARSMGFQPKAAADAAAAAAGNGANGAASAANGAAKPGVAAKPTASAAAPNGKAAAASVQDEIERIKNGQDASVSLSAGGGAPANPMTAQRLATMSDTEFSRMVETLSPEELQLLIEGSA